MLFTVDEIGADGREMTLGYTTTVMAGSGRPVIRIAVEGTIGSGKTIILAMIQEFLAGKAEVYVEDEYTRNELALEHGTDRVTALAMYSPVVLLCDRLVTDI
jgi:hypothetical protein